MKIYEKEITTNGGGKSRLLISCNKREIALLCAVVKKIYKYMPEANETIMVRDRLQNIKNCLNKALKEISNQNFYEEDKKLQRMLDKI